MARKGLLIGALLATGIAAAYVGSSTKALPRKEPVYQERVDVIPKVESPTEFYICGDPRFEEINKGFSKLKGAQVSATVPLPKRTVEDVAVLFEYHPTYITFNRYLQSFNQFRRCNLETNVECIYQFMLMAKLSAHLEEIQKLMSGLDAAIPRNVRMDMNVSYPPSTWLSEAGLAAAYLEQLSKKVAYDELSANIGKGISYSLTAVSTASGVVAIVDPEPASKTAFASLSVGSGLMGKAVDIGSQRYKVLWQRVYEDEKIWIQQHGRQLEEMVSAYAWNKAQSILVDKTIEAVVQSLMHVSMESIVQKAVSIDLQSMIVTEALKATLYEFDFRVKMDAVREKLEKTIPIFRQQLFVMPAVPYSCICPHSAVQERMNTIHREAQARADSLITHLIPHNKWRRGPHEIAEPIAAQGEVRFPIPNFDTELAFYRTHNIFAKEFRDCEIPPGVECPAAVSLIEDVRKLLPLGKQGLRSEHRELSIRRSAGQAEKHYTLQGNSLLTFVEAQLGLQEAARLRTNIETQLQLPTGDYADSLAAKEQLARQQHLERTNKLIAYTSQMYRQLGTPDYRTSQAGLAMMLASHYNAGDLSRTQKLLSIVQQNLRQLPHEDFHPLFGVVMGAMTDDWSYYKDAQDGPEHNYAAFNIPLWKDDVPLAIAECIVENKTQKWNDVVRNIHAGQIFRQAMYKNHYREFGPFHDMPGHMISLTPTALMALGHLICECNAPFLNKE